MVNRTQTDSWFKPLHKQLCMNMTSQGSCIGDMEEVPDWYQIQVGTACARSCCL